MRLHRPPTSSSFRATALVRHALDAASPAWCDSVPSPTALEAAVGAPQVKRSPDARPEIAAASGESRPAAGRAAELRCGRIIGNVERLIALTDGVPAGQLPHWCGLGAADGAVLVWVPHASAGLAVVSLHPGA